MSRNMALDLMLESLIQSPSFTESTNKNWENIAQLLPATSAQQCEQRYRELLQQHHNQSLPSHVVAGNNPVKSSQSSDSQNDQTTGPGSSKTSGVTSRENAKDASRHALDDQSPVMVIHVCDEAKNLKQDFHCWRDLLVKEMKYFAEYLSTDAQRWEDVDISVHCDVQIFDWLMKYVKRHTRDVTEPPNLEPSNVISILISSEFLKMDTLVQKCIEYCHSNMNAIIATPCNMNCINDKLVARIADLFTHHQANSIKDRKDKFKSKLFAKKIEKLFSGDGQLSDSPENASTLHRCGVCKRLVTKSLAKKLGCLQTRMTIDNRGKLSYSHMVDPSWDVNDFVLDLKKQLGNWREVYWRLWGQVNYLSCSRCGDTFPCAELGHCRYHSDAAQYESTASGTSVLGLYPCCGQKVLRFDPTEPKTGCLVRDHVVNLESADCDKNTQAQVYEDLLAHRDAITVPYQKPQPPAEEDMTVNVFSKDELVCASRIGSAKMAKSDTSVSDDSIKADPGNRPAPRLQALTVEKDVSEEDVGEGESDEDCEEEEDICKYYVEFPFTLDLDPEAKRRVPRKSRITVDPQAILLDAPDFGTTKIRKWDSSRSMRWNQDAQREEDQIRINEIVNYLTRLRLNHEKLEKLKQKEYAGGVFAKLEAQWKSVNVPPPKATNSLTRTKTRLTAMKI